jgi:hypothetical protein
MEEQLTVEQMVKWFEHASTHQLVCLRAELDRLQDVEDDRNGKHVPIPLTASILGQVMYQSEIKAQIRRKE